MGEHPLSALLALRGYVENPSEERAKIYPDEGSAGDKAENMPEARPEHSYSS